MSSNPLKTVRSLILDMDGVLWQDTSPIGDLPAIFQSIKNKGLKVILATNNATRSVASYQEKLQQFGVTLEPDRILTSSLAAAQYLNEMYPQGGKIFIVGEIGLEEAVRNAGFRTNSKENGKTIAVVVGMDRAVTFEKLRQATLLIRAGADFIGTNPDRSFPTPDGQIPGAGAILAALEAATDVKPTIIGKPGPIMYQQAMERLGTSPSETLAVGDRLETDILGGQNTGCKTALVLSGVTTLEQARTWHPPPDVIAANLSNVLDQI